MKNPNIESGCMIITCSVREEVVLEKLFCQYTIFQILLKLQYCCTGKILINLSIIYLGCHMQKMH